MGFYEEYKPFRNYMRRFVIVDGLLDVWRYFLHIIDGIPLPPGYLVGKPAFAQLERNVWPWDLEIIARELVLNASARGDRSLRKWNDLANAINHIQRLGDEAYKLFGDSRDVMFEMHRIAHRQFPWQIRIGVNPLMRALKIFGRPEVDSIVVQELGMTMRQVILLGIGLMGHFQKSGWMSIDQNCEEIGVPSGAAKAFFQRLTSAISALRSETAKQQSYGPDWAYAWNPLESTPLVSVDTARPERVVCPIPFYLIKRASTGIFYDLVNAPGFDNAFGESFQAYIGEVIEAVCEPPRFTAFPEEPYYIGSNKFHGVDWIVSDQTAHLFIETKTKRLTLGAKIQSDNAALERDLATMAKAIVQHYRNIIRALEGHTRWKPDGSPIYPVILTLEDWFIFSPRIVEMLSGEVRGLLAEQGIPERVVTEMPYTVAATHEFEAAIQVIAQAGIRTVMSKKTAVGQRNWSLLPFIRDAFSTEMKNINWRLFVSEWDRLLP